MTTRVDILRQALEAEGAARLERRHYFIDGPTQFYHYGSVMRDMEIVNYKVETYRLFGGPHVAEFSSFQEFYDDVRPKLDRVVEALKARPEIYNAFVMHGGNSMDIRVQFRGLLQ